MKHKRVIPDALMERGFIGKDPSIHPFVAVLKLFDLNFRGGVQELHLMVWEDFNHGNPGDIIVQAVGDPENTHDGCQTIRVGKTVDDVLPFIDAFIGLYR